MKKNIIMVAESFFKKWESETETTIKADTSWGSSPGVRGELTLHTPDHLTPNLRQVYLVSIEAVSLRDKEHPSEGYKRILAERAAEDEKDEMPAGIGRKFR